MSDYTQRDWSNLCYDINDCVVHTVKICFSRQARNTSHPKWYVAILGYNLAVYDLVDYKPDNEPIHGSRAYGVYPPDWVYEDAQRAIAEHRERYEELLNLMFLDTPEKRAEHLANKLAGRDTTLKTKEAEVYQVFTNGWKALIRSKTRDVEFKDSGLSGWVTLGPRRLNFEHSSNRISVFYSGTFLQMYVVRDEIEQEINKWIQKVRA